MALRVRRYLSLTRVDPNRGRPRSWVQDNVRGYLSSWFCPDGTVAITMGIAELAEFERVEALPQFANRAKPLRLGDDRRWALVQTPALKTLVEKFGVDTTQIPAQARVSDVWRYIGLTMDPNFHFKSNVSREFENEEGVD